MEHRRRRMEIKLPKFLGPDSHLIYLDDDYLVLDFETTNLDSGDPHNRIVLACWTIVRGDQLTHKHKWGGAFELKELLDDITTVKFVVAHNAKFEAQWLARCGLDLRDLLVCDTYLMQWVLDGNRFSDRHLDSMAKRLLGKRKTQDVSKWIREFGIQTEDIPRSFLLEYCKGDVELTLGVFQALREALRARGLLHLLHNRNITCTCLADIETHGMRLEADAVDREFEQAVAERNAAEKKLLAMCGGLNLNSPKQLGEFLYQTMGFKEPSGKTPTGRPLTDLDTVLALPARDKKQRAFLDTFKEFKEAQTALSKALNFFRGVVRERDGVFYGKFNQGRTKTHRLSSSGKRVKFADGSEAGVQFQNLHRKYKKLFRAKEDGWEIGEADGAQIEFRVAADMGHDPVAIEEISNSVNVHKITAKFLCDHGEETSYQDAKPTTFKPLYGGGAGSKAIMAYCDFFKHKYTEIAREQQRWAMEALNKGVLVTPYGMRFYWRGLSINQRGRVSAQTEIFNFPVQGMATGEIIPIALVHFWHRIRGTGIRIVNTVHDSIICEIPPGVRETFEKIAARAMTHDVYTFLREVYKYDMVTPLGTGIKIAQNWGEAKQEIVYNVFPDGTEKRTIKE
jgi:DNA polymerase I